MPTSSRLRFAPAWRARAVRNVAAVALVTGLVAGTVLWQTDDTWPLAQMRMFPGGGESAIALVVIEAKLADGRTKQMNPFAFHLKRAEIEGQMNRILADPSMLRDLAARYNRTVAPPRRVVGLALKRRQAVPEGAPGERRWVETELVRWPR
jgi:hypothetical protein